MLCPDCPPGQLQPLLQPLLSSLVQLLAAAEEESLHLVLEVLEAVIAAAAGGGGGLSPAQAMAVAQPVLQVRGGCKSLQMCHNRDVRQVAVALHCQWRSLCWT
jgi:hypothetical protein